MAKYLLLKHYRGGPGAAAGGATLEGATVQEWQAHIRYMDDLSAALRTSGEYVDSQALEVGGTFVRSGGPEQAVVTDGPFAETKDLVAGWWIVDVQSEGRAHEIAAQASAAPGVGGRPMMEWIEVRALMGDAPSDFDEISTSLHGSDGEGEIAPAGQDE